MKKDFRFILKNNERIIGLLIESPEAYALILRPETKIYREVKKCKAKRN